MMMEVVDHAATGREFSRLRSLAGLKQSEVALVMGIPATVLSGMENGRVRWTEKRRAAAESALAKLTEAKELSPA